MHLFSNASTIVEAAKLSELADDCEVFDSS